MTETPVATSKAQVYHYDPTSKTWVPKGKGPSRVDLYFNPATNGYRVIGRTQENEVVLNANFFKNMNYVKAQATSHQWADNRAAYCLTFLSTDESDKFYAAVIGAIQKLNSITPAPLSVPSAPATPPSAPSAPSVPSAPSAPPAPPTPLAPAAPPAPRTPAVPPGPPSTGAPPPPPGGVPPPPPPPGPGSVPLSSDSNGGSLAEQLAKAKLRKTDVPQEDAPPANPPMKIGGGMDMMSELQKKLAKKAAAVSTPPANDDSAPLTPKGSSIAKSSSISNKSKGGDDIDSLKQELKELRDEFRAFKAEMLEIIAQLKPQ